MPIVVCMHKCDACLIIHVYLYIYIYIFVYRHRPWHVNTVEVRCFPRCFPKGVHGRFGARLNGRNGGWNTWQPGSVQLELIRVSTMILLALACLTLYLHGNDSETKKSFTLLAQSCTRSEEIGLWLMTLSDEIREIYWLKLEKCWPILVGLERGWTAQKTIT